MVKKRHPERLPAEDVYHALALDGVSRATIKGYLETLRDSGQVDYYREDRCYTVYEDREGNPHPWSSADHIVLYLELPTGKHQGITPKLYIYPDGRRLQEGPDYEDRE
jgi:hypothetical protein